MTTYDDPEFDEPNPPEESSNRTFLLVAGILGARPSPLHAVARAASAL